MKIDNQQYQSHKVIGEILQVGLGVKRGFKRRVEEKFEETDILLVDNV